MIKRILITVMLFTIMLGCGGCKRDADRMATSVEKMILTLKGMRGTSVYIFEGDGDLRKLCQYREIYCAGKSELVLEKSVPCSIHAMIDLINACGILQWNGFHGDHPKNVLDGIMFDFEATVNGGLIINADGSANYPSGYHNFVRALDGMLADFEQQTNDAGNLALGLEIRSLPKEPLSVEKVWPCPMCGTENNGSFCKECGMPRS